MIPQHKRVSGLSGNEIYCLNLLNLKPGQLCLGNSVLSIGVGGGIGAGLSTLGGGEVTEITSMIHKGRMSAFNRLLQEAKQYGGRGLTGVSFEILNHGGNLEFLAMGSTIHGDDENEPLQFTTSADVQQLYCQEDSGFKPLNFVFGNVAYSIGLGGSILGSFRRLTRGEIPEYSEIFDQTRHLALARITQEAKNHGANAVVGIQTTISPLMGTQEMMMMGTASTHEALQSDSQEPVTSSLTNEEMWNLAHLGYLPIKLVMGVSVYSLGLKGGILATLKSIGGGEIKGLTEMLYEAREKALARIERDAELCGSDAVVNVQTRVYDLGGGMVEFMAIGTAVKKFPGITTKTQQLPPQAIIRNQDMFVDTTQGGLLNVGSSSSSSSVRLQGGPLKIIFLILFLSLYMFRIFMGFHH